MELGKGSKGVGGGEGGVTVGGRRVGSIRW